MTPSIRCASISARLSKLIAGARVDIVHAHSAGGAWCAMAASQIAVWLVTTLPDLPPVDMAGQPLDAHRCRAATG